MGKRIIQQRRGSGGPTYKVKSKAGKLRPGYLAKMEGEYECVKLIASVGHSVPIAKFMNNAGEIVARNELGRTRAVYCSHALAHFTGVSRRENF